MNWKTAAAPTNKDVSKATSQERQRRTSRGVWRSCFVNKTWRSQGPVGQMDRQVGEHGRTAHTRARTNTYVSLPLSMKATPLRAAAKTIKRWAGSLNTCWGQGRGCDSLREHESTGRSGTYRPCTRRRGRLFLCSSLVFFQGEGVRTVWKVVQ